MYQAFAEDDDLKNTCGDSPVEMCPCARIYYSIDADHLFHIDTLQGIITKQPGVQLQPGASYDIQISAASKCISIYNS